MKMSKIAIGLVLTIPVLVIADPPTTSRPSQSADVTNTGKTRFGGHRIPRGEMSEMTPVTKPSPPSADDVDRAMSFMQTYSPNKWTAISNQLGSDSRLSDNAKIRLQRQVIQKWRSYQLVADSQNAKEVKELAEFTLERIKIEDKIFGWVSEYRHGAATMPSIYADDLRNRIRNAEGDLIDLDIKERNARIASLNAMLAAEQEALKKVTGTDREKKIDEMTQSALGHPNGPMMRRGEQPHNDD